MSKLWFMTLLLRVLSFSATKAGACFVGEPGETAVLPCFYNGWENLASLNVSFEWRRGSDVVYTETWMEGREKRHKMAVRNKSAVSSLAQTGDFTLTLSDISVSDAQNYSMYLRFLDRGTSAIICTSCLTVAAHFTSPRLLREGGVDDVTRFVCQSWGGFPKPSVQWLINFSQRPKMETVTTHVDTLPHSEFYNVTSVLSANISLDTTVSCTINNQLLNETLTETSFGMKLFPVVKHHSAFPWVLSLVLFVLVTSLVAVALALQHHWDQEMRRPREEDSDCGDTEMIVMDMDYMDGLPTRDRCVL